MTALDALRNRRTRYRLAELAGASDTMVRAWLGGLPSAHAVLEQSLRDAAVKLGIDLATLPVLSPEAIAAAREKRRPKCKRCRELSMSETKARARVAELERRMPEACEACCGKGGHDDEEAQDQWHDCAVCDGTGFAPSRETLRLRERVEELEALLADKAPTSTHDAPTAEAPTPAPIPIVRRQDKPKAPVVRLEGFPPDDQATG
jgi:hypothetical protein